MLRCSHCSQHTAKDTVSHAAAKGRKDLQQSAVLAAVLADLEGGALEEAPAAPIGCAANRAGQVVAEFAEESDGWALAAWFLAPNHRLNDRRPVDVLGTTPKAVVEAASADRLVARQ